MQVTELSADGLKRQFKIVIPAGDLSAKVDERLAEMARTASLPGFRPGKVPAGLLKKQYGQALLGEALEQAVNQSTAKAIEDRGLKPAMQPKLELKGELGEGKDVEFEVVARSAAGDRPARFLGHRARAPEGRRAGEGRRRGAASASPRPTASRSRSIRRAPRRRATR